MVSKQKINKYAKLSAEKARIEAEYKKLGDEIKKEMTSDEIRSSSYVIKRSLIKRTTADTARLKKAGLFDQFSKLSTYFSLSVKELK